jgi:hypothetical protein
LRLADAGVGEGFTELGVEDFLHAGTMKSTMGCGVYTMPWVSACLVSKRWKNFS